MPTPDVPPPSSSEPCVAPEEYFSATYQAIGRFLVGCADAQTGIAWTLDVCIQKRLFKKRFSAEAMHVLAALSGETGMEKLRNLAKVIAIRLGSEKADVALINSASIHIKHLQEFRNPIAHHGAYPMAYDGRWCIQTSNKINVVNHDNREIRRYSIETLEAAADDCLKIVQRISHALFPEDRDMLSRGAINYCPLDPFSFDVTMIEKEDMRPMRD